MYRLLLVVSVVLATCEVGNCEHIGDALLAKWEEDRNEIVTANVRLRVIRSNAKPGILMADVLHSIGELGGSPSASAIETLLKSLVPDPRTKPSPGRKSG